MLPDSLAYFGETNIYWHGIIKALAIVGGIVLFWVLGFVQRPRDRAAKDGTWLAAPISLVLGLVISRLLYCYFNPEIGEKGIKNVFDFSSGGYVLYGAFLGAFLAVMITKLRIKESSPAEMFDAMAPAGALAICIGRLASYFSHEELGWPVESEKWQHMPFAAFDSTDEAWHLAVFNYEAVAAATAFIVAAVFFVNTYIRKNARGVGGSALAFLAVFTASQSLFESMRNDSVFLRSLGFVRFNQALSAIILCVIFVFLCVKLFKRYGFKIWMAVLWAAVAGCFTFAFMKEFRLTSGTLVSSYTIMGVCLATICVITLVLLWMYKFGRIPQNLPALPEYKGDRYEVPETHQDEAFDLTFAPARTFNRRGRTEEPETPPARHFQPRERTPEPEPQPVPEEKPQPAPEPEPQFDIAPESTPENRPETRSEMKFERKPKLPAEPEDEPDVGGMYRKAVFDPSAFDMMDDAPEAPQPPASRFRKRK